MLAIIIGAALIFLQILSYIGNSYAGSLTFFTDFSLYEIVCFVSFNFIGIIGLVFLILGIRSKLNEDPNDENTVIPEGAEPQKMKKPRLKPFRKICSFLLRHKKKIYISTIVSIVLLIIPIIGYNVCRTKSSAAYQHYTATAELERYSNYRYFLGCGSSSCDYCNGIKIYVESSSSYYFDIDKSQLYEFYYYSEINGKVNFFENLTNLFLILSIVLASISLILLVHTIAKEIRRTGLKRIVSGIYSFLLRHRKKIYVTTFTSIALLFVSLTVYTINSSREDEAFYHYASTIEKRSFLTATVGCDAPTCPYCDGTEVVVSSYTDEWITKGSSELDAFHYYNDVQSRMHLFETCGNVFLILSMVLASVSLIVFVPTTAKKIKDKQTSEEQID